MSTGKSSLKTKIRDYLERSGEIEPGTVDADGDIYAEPGLGPGAGTDMRDMQVTSRFRKSKNKTKFRESEPLPDPPSGVEIDLDDEAGITAVDCAMILVFLAFVICGVLTL